MNDSRRNRPRRRGVVLALVLAFIALGTVMAMTMLASTSLKAEVSSNQSASVSAQYCAESGLQTAIYYLYHPERAPALNAQGFYAGQTGMGVGSSTLETADVVVTSEGNDIYSVVATGWSGQTASRRVSRTARSRVKLTMKYLIPNAIAVNKNFTVPPTMQIIGDARSDGTLTISPGASVSGSTSSTGPQYSNWSAVSTKTRTAAPADFSEIVMMTTMSSVVPTYTYNGSIYHASLLPVSIPANPVANTVTNPANVWYADVPITLSSFTLNGTLIIRNTVNSPLSVTGTCRITPLAGMPGLIAPSDISFNSLVSSSLRVDGLVWLGGTIKSSTLIGTGGGTLNIRGALLWGGTAPKVNSNFNGLMKIENKPDNIKIDKFSNKGLTPTAVQILSWTR